MGWINKLMEKFFKRDQFVSNLNIRSELITISYEINKTNKKISFCKKNLYF